MNAKAGRYQVLMQLFSFQLNSLQFYTVNIFGTVQDFDTNFVLIPILDSQKKQNSKHNTYRQNPPNITLICRIFQMMHLYAESSKQCTHMQNPPNSAPICRILQTVHSYAESSKPFGVTQNHLDNSLICRTLFTQNKKPGQDCQQN